MFLNIKSHKKVAENTKDNLPKVTPERRQSDADNSNSIGSNTSSNTKPKSTFNDKYNKIVETIRMRAKEKERRTMQRKDSNEGTPSTNVTSENNSLGTASSQQERSNSATKNPKLAPLMARKNSGEEESPRVDWKVREPVEPRSKAVYNKEKDKLRPISAPIKREPKNNRHDILDPVSEDDGEYELKKKVERVGPEDFVAHQCLGKGSFGEV